MTLTTILPIALFGLFTVGLWFVMDLLSKNKSKADERLEALRKPKTPGGVAEGEKGAVSGMLEKAAPKLSSALKPQSELEQNALKVRLANAGFNSPGASQ
ncbi:MAG: type II secretion system F family protein, partial [Planctomycetota bacterium]